MIVMFFVSIIQGLIISTLSGLSSVALPFQLVGALGSITGYGAYIVGGDLLLIFASVVAFWLTVKLLIGIILFIWRLLPLT